MSTDDVLSTTDDVSVDVALLKAEEHLSHPSNAESIKAAVAQVRADYKEGLPKHTKTLPSGRVNPLTAEQELELELLVHGGKLPSDDEVPVAKDDQIAGMIKFAHEAWGPYRIRWVTTNTKLVLSWCFIRIIVWIILFLQTNRDHQCSYEKECEKLISTGIVITTVWGMSLLVGQSDGYFFRTVTFTILGFFSIIYSFLCIAYFAKGVENNCTTPWVRFAGFDMILAFLFVFGLINLIYVGIKFHRGKGNLNTIRWTLFGTPFVWVKKKSEIKKVFHDANDELSRSFGLTKPPLLPWYIRALKNYFLHNPETGLVFTVWDNDNPYREVRKSFTESYLEKHPARPSDILYMAKFLANELPDREGIRSTINLILHAWQPSMSATETILEHTPGDIVQQPPSPWSVRASQGAYQHAIELYHHTTLGRSDLWIAMTAVRSVLKRPAEERPAHVQDLMNLGILGPPGKPEQGIRERGFIGFRLVKKRLPNFLEDGPLEVGTVVCTAHEDDGNFDQVSTWEEIFLGTCCARFFIADALRKATAIAMHTVSEREKRRKEEDNHHEKQS